jgi:mannose/fructose/N-acetylgalactosamine-specific phosphotransferase system component IID
MTNFFYSTDAESIMNRFHGVDVMVYVEGQDDIPFWEFMFNKFSSISIEVQDVGSCSALEPYIKKIYLNQINAIVACDMDFTVFKDDFFEHNNIIKTFGYSIENSMLHVDNIHKAIAVIGRLSSKKVNKEEVQHWLDDFHQRLEHLIKMDIYNEVNALGISVVGDNSTRLMKSKTSCEICDEKLESYITKIIPNLTGYDRGVVESLIVEAGLESKQLLRGHFLFSAVAKFVANFVKSKGLKISLSNDALYSAFMLSLESTFTEDNNEFQYYKDALEGIIIAA